MAETRISLPQLISLAKELLEKISNIKTDNVSNSENKLQEYLPIILKLKEEYFQQGTDGILGKIETSIRKIHSIAEKTAEISSVIKVDISDCVNNKPEELQELGTNLVNNFVTSAGDVINKATENINNNAKNITDIKEELNNLPGKFSSNLISWNPMPAVNEFVEHVKKLIESLPDEITKTLTESTEIVNNLPTELLQCVKESAQKAETDANDIVKNTAASIGTKFGNAVIDYLLE